MAAAEAASKLAMVPVLIKRAAFEPFLTGPLLIALTRGPVEIRQYLRRYVPYFSDDHKLRLLIKTLKWLVAIGAVSRLNAFLNTWAMNHFRLQKPGVPWDFTNQKETAVVTGGCNGFGLLIVKGLAGKMKVVILDIVDLPKDLEGREYKTSTSMRSTAYHLAIKGAGVSFYKCDITDAKAVSTTAATIRREVGVPTILINNAGIATAHTILDTSEEYLQKVFRVNVLSHFTLIKEFLPGMLKQQKGHIMSMASMASYVTPASLTDYCCTKAAVLALHEGLNQELRYRYPNGRCIQTTIIHPMWAQTALIKDWETSLASSKTFILQPSAIADPVVKQVLSGRSGHLYVPASGSSASGIRGWPSWMQDYVRAGLAAATAK